VGGVACVGAPALIARAILGPTIPSLVLALAIGGPLFLVALRRSAGVLRFPMLRDAFRRKGGGYRLVEEVVTERAVVEP
jgi:hypothetical protein